MPPGYDDFIEIEPKNMAMAAKCKCCVKSESLSLCIQCTCTSAFRSASWHNTCMRYLVIMCIPNDAKHTYMCTHT